MNRDETLFNYLKEENNRQNDGIELIASENFASKYVRALCGSVLTNKYAEGFPGKRYYGGCVHIDEIENRAIELVTRLFNCKYACVQPHSGTQANMIAYYALLNTGDKILSLSLDEGGHLSHGSKVSFSSKYYNVDFYHLNKNGRIDYDALKEKALEFKPQLILAGFSAYPFEIDYKRIKEIARAVGAYFMVDMAHIAGLIAAKELTNPLEYADIVTSTTHKTLRGPRGGIVLTNDEEIIKKVNKACFPALQGGPLENIIAAKAECFYEALQPEYKEYIHQVKINTKACSDEFTRLGDLNSGTENHLFLLNTKESFGITGKEAQEKLEEIGITLNKNMLPNDTEKPSITSGVRVGFAAITTRRASENDAIQIARIIDGYLKNKLEKSEALIAVKNLTKSWKQIEEI